MAINIAKAVEGASYHFVQMLPLPKELLQGRLAEFVTDCKVEGEYTIREQAVLFESDILADINYQCDKCLKPSKCSLSVPFCVVYTRKGSDVEGDFVYTNYDVDILEGVSQEVLLAIPYQMLCQDDCKGLCPVCGKDLNAGDCDCLATQEDCVEKEENPFSKLNELKKFSGGASNGSTKG